MSCSFTEKISLLIDGELNACEESLVQKHLAGCEVCQQAQEDFLRLRQQIKSYAPERDLIAQRHALREILGLEKVSWWLREVTLPVPALAFLLVALIALGTWAVILRNRVAPEPNRETFVPPKWRPIQDGQEAVDFSRYDRGERAVIYKTQRARPDATRR